MKKFGLLLLIGCLALLVSSSIFAADPTTFYNVNAGQLSASDIKENANVGASTTLYAYVTPYAAVSFNDDQAPKPLVFSGVPNEVKGDQDELKVTYNLESNCDVNVDGFGTAFKGTKDGQLDTWYKLIPADAVNGGSQWRQVVGDYVWAPEGFDHKYVEDGGPVSYNVHFKASSGPKISSQRAGNYTATYTVTVWSPVNLND